MNIKQGIWSHPFPAPIITLRSVSMGSLLCSTGSTVNSEDVPSYMRMTAAATRKDRLAPSAVDQEEISPPQPIKRGRSGSLRDLDLGVQPSYMKPTNR